MLVTVTRDGDKTTVRKLQLSSLYLNWPEVFLQSKSNPLACKKTRPLLLQNWPKNPHHRAFRSRCELDWVRFRSILV
ncbi:hypothetical protein SLEP1_g9394 [Rubroshorea leprosula]|uniref:Uncharacterized protein n=1 Tax=Rubroshorea leprosula TaxID=152421 RepID=A0AAV5ICR3_9ROSI|nr:hypothetical protein SLEP1_g9394 [Rubroshorea leprosula]